jgi:hypothetical protein
LNRISCFRLPSAVAALELLREARHLDPARLTVAVLTGWVVEAAVKWQVGLVLSHFQ